MKKTIFVLAILIMAVSVSFAKGRQLKMAKTEPQKAEPAPQETLTPANRADSDKPEIVQSSAPVQFKGPRIEKVDDATLRFLDAKGRVWKEMKLRRKRDERGKVPSKFELYKFNPDADVRITDEDRAYPSPTGEYVAVVHEESIGGEEYLEIYEKTVKVYDAKTGEVLLERDDIKWGVEFSENGRRMDFIVKKNGSEKDECLFTTYRHGPTLCFSVNIRNWAT